MGIEPRSHAIRRCRARRLPRAVRARRARSVPASRPTTAPRAAATLLVGLALALALIAAGCRGAARAPADRSLGPGQGRVSRVVDGDTIVVDLASGSEKVRLLGIDTPETKSPTKPVQCFGAEASARTAELLPVGTPVRLERDVEARDAYGRLLAYVYRAADGLFVNRSLVADGYADLLTYRPNVAHLDELTRAVDEARGRQAGLWGRCGGPGRPAATGAETPSR